jgi:predicted PhzF superfamily epimerase YddE/YHI9
MPTTPCFQVDAFTSRAFRGNPAAVCLLDKGRTAKWMQDVAAEMNLSETAFVVPLKSGFRLRWFAPVCEIDLCGHATLATAHVLFSEGVAPDDAELRFATRSGVLTARQAGRGIELDFPARPRLRGAVPEKALAAALGARPKNVCKVADDFVFEVASEAAVRRVKPDFAALAKVKMRGVIVTAKGSGRHDFVSRWFGPRTGVDEDPVTGSAHCALAPYWGERLGKTKMKGFQASPRGGEVEVEQVGERVLLRGKAVTVMRGQLTC